MKSILKESTSSATQLFGDKLKDEMKVLNEKAISLTHDNTATRHLLGLHTSLFYRSGGPPPPIPRTTTRLPIQPDLQRSGETLIQAKSNIQKGTRVEGKLQEKLKVSTESLTLVNTKDNFIAGKTASHFNEWVKLTNDRWILNTICGYSVELCDIPMQEHISQQIKFSDVELIQINEELNRFLDCNIIEKVHQTDKNEFISNIFTRPKKDGKIRVILNLRQFNEKFMEHIHFKMETLKAAVDAMRPDCFFGSVDLSEAFYSVPIRVQDRKYFRFIFDDQKYQFTCLVMGLATSPRVFTKILKPIFASLRTQGFISTAYIDDNCLQGSTFEECQRNIWSTVKLMDSLGFTVHLEKSVLIPTKRITFLGFLLCSETMTVRLTQERVKELLDCCSTILGKSKCPIRQFAKMIGKMVAAEPGVEYAPTLLQTT